jgi:hypothetical protein
MMGRMSMNKLINQHHWRYSYHLEYDTVAD